MGLRSCIPDRDRLLGSRWPFADRLRDPHLWHLNRESTARGLALRLFIGLLVRIGQTPIAAFLAISIRAHLIVAAGATLVTNPLTIPDIYHAALRWGETQVTTRATEGLLRGPLSFAAPIAVGLLLFAIACGAMAYAGVKLFWRAWTIRRWRNRPSRNIPIGTGRSAASIPGAVPIASSKASLNAMVERHE
jgi:uncharacterized protein (DUF2062 family)